MLHTHVMHAILRISRLTIDKLPVWLVSITSRIASRLEKLRASYDGNSSVMESQCEELGAMTALAMLYQVCT